MSRSCLIRPDSLLPLRPQSGPFVLREFWCGAESYGTFLSRSAGKIHTGAEKCMELLAFIWLFYYEALWQRSCIRYRGIMSP